jgi:hypothetical protein
MAHLNEVNPRLRHFGIGTLQLLLGRRSSSPEVCRAHSRSLEASGSRVGIAERDDIFVASSVLEGKHPFAPAATITQPSSEKAGVMQAGQSKHSHKAARTPSQ